MIFPIFIAATLCCSFSNVFSAPDENTKQSNSSDQSMQIINTSKKVFETKSPDLVQLCNEWLVKFPGSFTNESLKSICNKVSNIDSCKSVKNEKIFHYERKGYNSNPKKILVFSLIHGDETSAGSVGRFWMERLETIEPRNHWRVIPVLNPDGVNEKTRFNANKVDLNRNFPTKDWDDLAQKYWKLHAQSSPRRFPGEKSASEPEVICAMEHINEFKPDFIISIHTPLNVLDFDGPKIKPPKFEYLPWRSLGHFPGSLGRYMWAERKIPVLTMELKNQLPKSQKPFETLQDIIGTLVKYESK